ncbi:hypothetical protein J4207_03895 [Candidatus Woesearchaeota archaeon]|nr:hypothetical protein [Candidatus Woesearchaeota archaeon]
MNKKGFLDDFLPYLAVGAFVIVIAVILVFYGATKDKGQQDSAEKDLLTLEAHKALQDYLKSSFKDRSMAEYLTVIAKQDSLYPDWEAQTKTYFESRYPQRKTQLVVKTSREKMEVPEQAPEVRTVVYVDAYLPSDMYDKVVLTLNLGIP